jgi:predicted transcriptional regulator
MTMEDVYNVLLNNKSVWSTVKEIKQKLNIRGTSITTNLRRLAKRNEIVTKIVDRRLYVRLK